MFFKERLQRKYPGTLKYNIVKPKQWKMYYLENCLWVKGLKKNFNYIYEKYQEGIPKVIYGFLSKYRNDKDWGLFMAAKDSRKHLVEYYLEDPKIPLKMGLCGAANSGNWEIINLLVDKGANNWKAAILNSTTKAARDFFEKKLKEENDRLNRN